MRVLESRYLPWTILTAFGVFVAALWALGALGAARPTLPGSALATENASPRAPEHAREKHYVTPRQLADANAMVSRSILPVRVTDQDGRRLGWDDLSGGQPVVLVFLKEGCPCNADFEPFFQRVARLYRGAARFAGVIDADTEAARHYAQQQQVPYPILADPGRDIIRRSRAENGGYVVLLTSAGVIDGAWPGCSADTLRALSQRIARLTGQIERPLNITGISDALLTGCPFDSSP